MAEVRALTTHHEFGEAVRLQRQIWGFEDIDLVPPRLFVVATKIGGQVLGAFDGERMVGFCIALPGWRHDGADDPRAYLHSHMLGVLPEYRNAGIGRAIKLAQREEALARGIDLVEWTFDPLELKNAQFNIERLGAIVRRYVRNQYGITTSPLHGGLPTDRCVAEWWLRAPRVAGTPSVRVAVPANIAEVRTLDPERARAIQAATADALEKRFRRRPRCHRLRTNRRRRNLSVGEMGIAIDRIVLREIRMPLVHPFETSFGRTTERRIILVEVCADGLSGWGEVTCGEQPFYNEEWTDSAWLILRDYSASPEHVRGHQMALGGLEAAMLGSGSAPRRCTAMAAHWRWSAP